MSENDSEMTQGEVWETLEAGDKVLWDSIKQPVTIKSGYKDYKEKHGEEPHIIMAEGPQGGEKMMCRNKHNTDNISVGGMTLSASQDWISGLKKVE